MSKSKTRHRPAEPDPGAAEEWVVGRVPLPMYVTANEPFRPDLVLCVDPLRGLLGAETIPKDAGDEGAVSAVLAISRAPAVGPPRSPRRIRVASPSLKEALARRLGAGVTITLGATPEIDAMAARFIEGLRAPERWEAGGSTYLTGGRIDPELGRTLFEAAARLRRTAPWTVVPSDGDTLVLDIPSVGARDLCVSVIGRMGPRRGLVMFASVAAYRAHVAAQKKRRREPLVPPRTLCLGFEPITELSGRMRAEIAQHGWRVEDAGAVPVLLRIDEDGVGQPLEADDFVLGRIVGTAVALFFERHRTWPLPGAAPLAERFVLEDLPGGPEVGITADARPLRPQGPRAAAPKADLRGVKPTTETAVRRICDELWGEEFMRRHDPELDAAMAELGDAAGPDLPRDALGQALGSLPGCWATLWRPMRDGRTGAQVARSWRKLDAPVLRAALDRIEAARGVYGEVVSAAEAGHMRLRDLFDGTTYRIGVDAEVSRELTRWTRLFGVLVDLGDGSWTYPSQVQSVPASIAPTPAGFVDVVRAALAGIGIAPDEIDPGAPHAGLTRWAAIVFVALLRIPVPEVEPGPAAKAGTAELVLSSLRRGLDETVPALGGVPRALVATEAGRSAVEAWLRETELAGVSPGRRGDAFLDLDPLREELGLPTVAAEIARAP